MLAARPKTLWASVAPVAMGSAMAYRDGGFHLLAALCALFSALCIQIGTNYCNDYADFKRGTDDASRTGPTRAVAAGLVTSRQMMWATVFVFALGGVVAIYLIQRAGWPLALVGALSVASGVLYTEGPKPLAYLGLGDVFTLIFFGPVAVAGTYYAQTVSWSWAPVIAGFGPGLLSAAILTVNNLRDRDGDARTGKRTLPVRFGVGFARFEYCLCVTVAAAIPFYLVFKKQGPYWALLASLVFLAAIPAFIGIRQHQNGPKMNRMLAYTGFLSLLYALFFSVGWLL